MPEYAKKVFSFEFHRIVDRATERTFSGAYDIDIRNKKSSCLLEHQWTQAGSYVDLKMATSEAIKIAIALGVETRVVNVMSGEVMKDAKKAL
jgi:hypothetical protein